MFCLYVYVITVATEHVILRFFICKVFLDTILSFCIYSKTSCTSRTKFPNLNVSRIVLQLFLLNPLEAGVKSRMKM